LTNSAANSLLWTLHKEISVKTAKRTTGSSAVSAAEQLIQELVN
jgi:hypothetical protein